MNEQVAQFVGVDISKMTLDVHLHPNGAEHRFANDKKGFKALIKWLGAHAIAQVVFEPTGAYHRGFETCFLEAGFTLAKVNPRKVRRFADAIGISAKTDALDARLLARFAAMTQLRPLAPDSAELNDMRDLLVARRGLVKDLTAMKNRAQQRSLALLKAQAARRIKQIQTDLKDIDAELQARVRADAALKGRFDILVSIPGLGAITATTLLVDMPELGTLDPQSAASLAGLAPIARESGQWRGRRFIGGGRRHVRHALYMPALVAAQFNADLKVVYQRLIDAGKPAKLAITAIMRKLLLLANALLKKGVTWTPKPA